MALAREFQKELKERYEPQGYTISEITTTKHRNVMRLEKDGKTFIAKTIWSEMGNKEDEKRADKAFRLEVSILKRLPSWWGLQILDSFQTYRNRVIVTSEIPNIPWSQYKGTHAKELINQIEKQIKWLNTHGFCHNDMELKNILLSEDSSKAILIDFEKTKKTKKCNDTERLRVVLEETPKTKKLVPFLKKKTNTTTNITRKRTRK
jgi:serine/threonine protein kinase